MQLSGIKSVSYKRYGFSVNDCFLSVPEDLNADINYCIQCPENIDGQLSEFYTLLIDLKLPLELIWENIYHRTRSEILSFTNNQAFEHKIVYNLSGDELKLFTGLFDRFAREKKIRLAEQFRVKAYNDNGILAVSFIKQNEEFLCVNIYRLTKHRATNLYSYHVQNSSGNTTSSHLGRAHRALHWMDIKEFKTIGVEFYDFCGWYNGTEDKSLLNINKFKEQFTSFKVKEYSGVIYKSKLLKLLKRIK